MAVEKIGLIAGRGNLPFEVLAEINAKGKQSVVIGLKGEVAPELSRLTERFYKVEIGNLQKMLDLLKEEQVSELVFAGKVGKKAVFGQQFDKTFQALLARLPEKNDDAILGALVAEFEANGITVAKQTDYLNSLLMRPGVILGSLTPVELADVELGFRVAKAIGGIDIGQSVVIKSGVVIAVEAIEGTDQAIIRGGKLAGPGTVVVKVSKPNQDQRFDVPTVGKQTIASMIQAQARVLAIEAEQTLVTEREALLKLATVHQIKIIAL